MNEGDIILAPLPQADGRIKNRPAVLLRRLPPFDDWLVCGVSTQVHQRVADFDELIVPGDPAFGSTGLKTASILRLGFLAVLPEEGENGVRRRKRCQNRFLQEPFPFRLLGC